MNDSLNLLMQFTLNFLTAFVIIRFIYYPTTRNKDYVFTFFTFNTIIFFVSILLRGVDLSVGFGFGLFAIFSILRYRTDPIPIKEISYLFIIMALPFMNALFVNNEIFMRTIPINVIIIGIVYFIESEIGTSYESKRKIKYEKIELVKPESYPLLLADLEERTGLKITRFEVCELDFLRDTADLIIYYDSSEKSIESGY
ncbi:MAG: DUF4956 domain-containing protein [Ardenticatenaceae bacterium]